MRILSLLLAVAIAGGVALWVLSKPETQTAENGDARTATIAVAATLAPLVQTLESQARDLQRTVLLRGRAEAWRKVDVKAETAGLVTDEPPRKGARVAAGDLLCRLDPGDRPAQLAEAKAKLARASSDATASSRLGERGFAAETRIAADNAALAEAEAMVRRMEIDIARLEIRAPFDGVLETDAAEFGSLLMAGDLCATVIALQPIKFVAYAPEAQVDRIVTGQVARARAATGAETEAEVSFVARSADPDTRTFRVEALADNPAELFRDGATVELAVETGAVRAHALPHSALTLDDAGRLGVRVAVGGPALSGSEAGATGNADAAALRRASFAPVSLLRDEADQIWVGGLPERADVIVVGQDFVKDGATVRIRAVGAADPAS